MRTCGGVALLAVVSARCVASAQDPRLELRFSNGTNAITVEPGAAVPVQVWAAGLPGGLTQIPWTTPPGTGQLMYYAGFQSVFMDVTATGGAWSGLTVPSPPFALPPFGSLGTITGSDVRKINVSTGFYPPVTQTSFLLWSGTLAVGSSDVSLGAEILPVGLNRGFHVWLNYGGFVEHFMQTANGTAYITVPAPVSLALLGLGGLLGVRRKRTRSGGGQRRLA